MRSTLPRRLALAAALLVPTGPVAAEPNPGPGAAPATPTAELEDLSLEDLLEIEITTLARGGQTVGRAAAAVYVLTAEDIERSGATSLPEALRLVPGVEVARINANNWAITIRGFNSLYANKLLVLIDGRSVYTPLFGGVYWADLDIPLDDIDHIEVVRGPGGSVWGANAVHGVINVVTRSSATTSGNLVRATVGTADRAVIDARHGGRLGDDGHYRLWARATSRAGGDPVGGIDARDGWDGAQVGFRADGEDASRDAGWRVDARAYAMNIDNQALGTTSIRLNRLTGGHALAGTSGPWAGGVFKVQGFLDTSRRDGRVTTDETTFDLDVQHAIEHAHGERTTWGAGFRHYDSSIDSPGEGAAVFDPAARDLDLWSTFVQYEFGGPRSGRFTAGARLEHNDFTGWELQPGVRWIRETSRSTSVWLAVSRAVRTPSRAWSDVTQTVATNPGPGPGQTTTIEFRGSDGLPAEDLLSAEAGLRWFASPEIHLDVAAFHFAYDDLSGNVLGPPEIDPATGDVTVPLVTRAVGSDSLDGFEVTVQWAPNDRFRTTGWWAWLDWHPDLSKLGASVVALESSPRNRVHLRSTVRVREDLDLDVLAWWVDELEGLDVDAYARLDLRLAWRPSGKVEIGLTGRNLTEDRHVEFRETTQFQTTAVRRSLQGWIRWTF